MRHRALIFVALLSVPAGIVALACGGGSSTGPDDPNAVDGGAKSDGGGSDSGSSGDGGGGTSDDGPSCSNVTFKASDNPTCDTCAKGKCCTEVLACSASADCQAFNDCLSQCADGDIACVLTCASLHDKGSGIAQDLAACAQSKCKTECPLPDAGSANFDF